MFITDRSGKERCKKARNSMNTQKKDFLIGLACTIFGVVMLVWVIPNHVTIPSKMSGVSPAAFPTVVSWLITIFGASLTIRTATVDSSVPKTCWKYVWESAKAGRQVILNVTVTGAILIGFYAILMLVRSFDLGIPGFLIAAPICTFLMGWWLQWKKVISLLLTAVLTTTAIYLVFQVVMQVRLP